MSESVIRFENVSKAFGPRKILDEVSFDISRGEAFCLMGRSGTGKSVTLRLMIGLLRADAGKITVLGEDLSGLEPLGLSRLRQQIGYLFQYSALFDSITVGENVAFPMRWHTDWTRTEIRQRSGDLLDQLGLGASYNKMPAELSGGMRKRVGLARALALRPPVLLVDEPSSGLDPITSEEIDRLLIDLKSQSGTTMVVVTHNIPSARRIGDVLALLDNGRIVDRGTPAELENSSHEIVHRFMSAAGGT